MRMTFNHFWLLCGHSSTLPATIQNNNDINRMNDLYRFN